MILLYHKIAPKSLTQFWVDSDTFYRHMIELSDKEVVPLSKYNPQNPKQVVITFDDIYENVYHYAFPILKKCGYPFELFIIGNYIGKRNTFDTIEPPSAFTTKQQLLDMVKGGGKLQWHTATHPNMGEALSEKHILRELLVPEDIKKLDPKGFKWFAYPYGNFTQETRQQVSVQFNGAVSCVQGSDSDTFALNRITVTNNMTLSTKKISVIIPSYNYGKYLVEAVDSVLKQTYPPSEICLIDDGSIDDTATIGMRLAEQYPELIKFTKHDKNEGIIFTFNEAVHTASGDYVCILDADNRFRSDFLEKTTMALNMNKKAAIAYTDFAFFGSRAEAKYSLFPVEWRKGIKANCFYTIGFPTFNEQSRNFLKIRNFIHGNSLYKRDAFLQVGGYKSDAEKPEDHSLFYRMVEEGWDAVHIPEPLLEYRQHAKEQENDRFNYFAQLDFYRTNYQQLLIEKRALQTMQETIPNSKVARLKNVIRNPKAVLKKVMTKVVIKLKRAPKKIKNIIKSINLIGVDYSHLHLGCGARNIPGWFNADIDTSFGPHVHKLDLRKPLPFPNQSVSKVFIEHTIENLTKHECISLFNELHRVMKKDAPLRIGISDNSKLITAYVHKDQKFRDSMQKDMQPLITDTWDEFLMDMLFNWHRRSHFSPPLLTLFLQRAGLKNIKESSFGKSEYGFNFDTRPLLDNVYLEAQNG